VGLDFGDPWAASGVSALLLPSVIVAEERNILINSLHADAKMIMASKIRKRFYDARIR
jgi:hypothetical protein